MNSTNDSRSCNRIAFYLDTYYQLFIIIVGLIGNSMTIIIFWRTKLAHSKKTSFYLISLAISDIAFLITLLVNYIDMYTVIKLTSKYSYFCKLITFIGFTIAFLSVGLVLAFTVQRLCSICFPLSKNKFNLERRSKTIVISLIVVGCLIYAYNLSIYDVEIENEEMTCRAKTGYENQAERFFFFDSLFTLIIPFFGLLVMNAMIIKTLKNSNYNFFIRTSNNSKQHSNNDQIQNSNSIHNQNPPLPIGSEIALNFLNRTVTETSSKKKVKKKTLESFKPKYKNKETQYHEKQPQDEGKKETSENDQIKTCDLSVCYKKSNSNMKDDLLIKTKFLKIKNEKNSILVKPGSKLDCNSNNIKNSISNSKKRCKSIEEIVENQNKNTNNIIELKNKNSVKIESESSKNKILKLNSLNTNLANHDKFSNRKINRTTNLKRECNQKSEIKSCCKCSFRRSSTNHSPTILDAKHKNRNSFNLISTGSQNRMSFRIAGPRTNSVSRKITKMLIIVSSTFLVLNLPIHTFNIYIYVSRSFEEYSDNNNEFSNSTIIFNSMSYTCQESNIRSIVNNIFYTSFSCNFLLYSISGVTFRNECKRLLYNLLRINIQKQ